MSLFCQLLSINEAINDIKLSINDRYSDFTGSEYTCSELTGSEYSFGGMGSRADSLSSLLEENEWNRSTSGTYSDDLLSADASPGVDREPCDIVSSTSSLLQQIKALTQRAEDDF